MRKLLSAIGSWATKIESWLALGAMAVSAGLFAWLGQQWELLASQGWAAVTIFAVVVSSLLLISVSLTYLAMSRGRTHAVDSSEESRHSPNPASEAPEPSAYYDLVSFTVQTLLPACDARIALNEAIVQRLGGRSKLTELALDGLRTEPPSFWGSYEELIENIHQSEPTLRFGPMMTNIREMELRGYAPFCARLDDACVAVGLDYRADSDLAPLWEEWRLAHNKLVDEYERIKNDIRYSKPPKSQYRSLFWPRKESQWGAAVPSASSPA